MFVHTRSVPPAASLRDHGVRPFGRPGRPWHLHSASCPCGLLTGSAAAPLGPAEPCLWWARSDGRSPRLAAASHSPSALPPRPPPQASAPWSTASPQDSCSGAGWPSPCSCLASWSRASATCGSERTGSQASAGQPRCTSCSSACGSGKLVTRGRGRALPARVPPPGTAKLAAPSQHLAPWSRKWAQLPAQAGLRSPAGDVCTKL